MSASPFNHYAQSYDSEFTDSSVGRALRDLVWSRYDALFAPGQRVLELGCGTGEDALHLAKCGIQVVATDAAEKMVAIARDKAVARGLAERIEFHVLPMERIATLRDLRFDGVISNFGAINCVRNVPTLIAHLAPLLKPGAPLLWVIMGRDVPWEWLWYLSQGQVRKAFRRYSRNGVEWRGLTIRYPRPGNVARSLSPHFDVRRLAPLGCVLPPSYAATWLNRRKAGLKAFARAEKWFQTVPFLASFADHYMIEAARKSPT